MRVSARTGRTWDHLRVCGADLVRYPLILLDGGSPPRVRSRHLPERPLLQHAGITSACAKQTHEILMIRRSSRDHLRVCGADDEYGDEYTREDGSPPRVRSRQPENIQLTLKIRITSACAEQTTVKAGG